MRQTPGGGWGWAASAVVVLLLAVDRLGDPSATYLLGTDQLGRDVLSRLIHGARTSLGVGFAATLLSTVVALLVGGVAGFVGGKLYILWCSDSSTPGCPSPVCCCC